MRYNLSDELAVIIRNMLGAHNLEGIYQEIDGTINVSASWKLPKNIALSPDTGEVMQTLGVFFENISKEITWGTVNTQRSRIKELEQQVEDLQRYKTAIELIGRR